MPKSQFKVQDIENCTRKGSAQRGRAIVHMISRHFDLDRFRGSLNTSQSVFAVELHGYAVSDLEGFPLQLMKVLNRSLSVSKKAYPPKAKAVATTTPAVPPKSLAPKPSEVKAVPANLLLRPDLKLAKERVNPTRQKRRPTHYVFSSKSHWLHS